jgi:hypothetical protein
MKRRFVFTVVTAMIVFFIATSVYAADIEAQLDSDAAASAFSLKNLSSVEKVRMDAVGAITAAGIITAPNFVSGVATGTQPYAATSTTLNTNLNADQWDSQHLPALSNGQFLTNNGSTLSWVARPTIKSGIVNLAAGGTAAVTFNTPFAAVPQVVATEQFSTTDTSTTLSCYSVTVNGFTLRGAGNAAGNVAWIATDAGNP